MVFNNFRIQCIVRVILLGFSVFLFFYIAMKPGYLAATLIIGILPIWQVFLLFRFIEISHRNLKRFLDSIRYSDFSTAFKGNENDASLRELNNAFNNVIKDFKKEREQRE